VPQSHTIEPIVQVDKKVDNIVTVDTNTTKVIQDNTIEQIDKLAIVYNSKNIGKYAIEATNSAITTLLFDNKSVELKVYDINTQNSDIVSDTLNKIYDENITKIIFMITPSNLKYLVEYKNLDNFKIYLPLINSNQTKISKPNFMFGGIDYTQQFNMLLHNNPKYIVEIYDDSNIGETLHKDLLKTNHKIVSYKLSGKHPNFAAFLKRYKKYFHSTLVLNTSIVKSSIILSQLRANNIQFDSILSSQVNYTALLFILTQKEDREKLKLANSIGKLPIKLQGVNLLLNNDILYNWVNYSVIVGVKYLLENGSTKLFKTLFQNNQVQYTIDILQAQAYKFEH